MHITRSVLLILSGAMAGIAFILSCGDNLSVKANADAAIDAPKAPDAAPTCDCPAAEPPLSGRIVVVSNTRDIPPNFPGGTSVVCPEGSQLISGSCTQDQLNPVPNITLEQSGFFAISPREWFCLFRNNEFMTTVTIRASATCLKLTP